MNQHQKCKQALKEISEIIEKYNIYFLVYDQDKKTLKNVESFAINEEIIQINTLKTSRSYKSKMIIN